MKKSIQLFILIGFANLMFSQTLDSSFGNGGKVIQSVNSGEDKAFSVLQQTDGKLIVSGYTFSSVFGYDFLCLRYNIDGTLDSTFGNNGVVTIDVQPGADDRSYSSDLQLDGKIVLAGYSDDGTDRDGAVVRLNTDGSLDTSFGVGGKAITNVRFEDIYNAVKVHLVTGNIVVGGASYSSTNRARPIFARYTSTGVLDTTFNGTGFIDSMPSPINTSAVELVVEDIALKSNGRITAVGWVAGGSFGDEHYHCRINTDGSLDTTFDTNGYDFSVITTGNDRTYSILLNADDSFVFSGYTPWTSSDYRTYISTTPSSGTSTSLQSWLTQGANSKEVGFGLERDQQGKVLVAGFSVDAQDVSSFLLTRNNADYSNDTTFGNAGYVTTAFGAYAGAYDLLVQQDGKIVLVGYTDDDLAIARYTDDSLSLTESNLLNITLYPNPAKDFISLNNLQADHNFQIIDLNGKLISQGNVSSVENRINVKSLSNGFYFLVVKDGEQSKTFKFSKN
ncbi:MAG: T9SS type A sorting domain-containing protein [Nonlabens sp.]|uniref:T9SS type A sorting domain-containing protein n=1 Tax=Nonlabens sp. TaxID=1888209 RepID=UPI003EF44BF7